MNSEVLNLLFSILGILAGIITSYIFYLLALRDRQPSYSIFTYVSDIPFLTDGLDHAGFCEIYFWNNGAGIINKEDVVNKICVSFPKEVEITNAEIKRMPDVNNLFRITQDKNTVLLDFEYIDQYEGCVIEVSFACREKDKIVPHIGGRIKGVYKLKQVPYFYIKHRAYPPYNLPYYSYFFLLLVVIFNQISKSTWISSPYIYSIISSLFLCVGLIIMGYSWIRLRNDSVLSRLDFLLSPSGILRLVDNDVPEFRKVIDKILEHKKLNK